MEIQVFESTNNSSMSWKLIKADFDSFKSMNILINLKSLIKYFFLLNLINKSIFKSDFYISSSDSSSFHSWS